MSQGTVFSPIDVALKDLKEGKFVIVLDSKDREDEGDLVMAASLTDSEKVAFCVNHTTGILCAPMTAARATALELPMMVRRGTDPHQTPYTISTDSSESTTGVSSKDRARTFVQLADPKYKAANFVRPGHVFPLIARPGGVFEREGHTEAAVDLLHLAGLPLVGLIAELVNCDGSMKRLPHCLEFARQHNLKIISVQQIVAHRSSLLPAPLSLESKCEAQGGKAKLVELVGQCELPIKLRHVDLGQWTTKCFFSHVDGRHHVSVEKGDITREPYDPVLTRIHSECFSGDTLGSQRCDCAEELFKSLKMIHQRGRGVCIYHFENEDRGSALAHKILAYHSRQDRNEGIETAKKGPNFKAGHKDCDTPRAILKSLGIQKIALLTSNPDDAKAFSDLVASVVPLGGTPSSHTSSCLDASSKDTPKSQRTAPLQPHKGGTPNIGDMAAPMSSAPAYISRTATEKQAKSAALNLPVQALASQLKVAIVRTSWNESYVGPFTAAIYRELLNSEVHPQNVRQVLVPGSFEIPYAAKMLCPHYDVVICVGVLIKGETLHFEMISEAVTHGLMKVQLDSGVPIINAVLNCLTEGQVEARCGPDSLLPASLASTAFHMAALKKGCTPGDFKSLQLQVVQPCVES